MVNFIIGSLCAKKLVDEKPPLSAQDLIQVQMSTGFKLTKVQWLNLTYNQDLFSLEDNFLTFLHRHFYQSL